MGWANGTLKVAAGHISVISSTPYSLENTPGWRTVAHSNGMIATISSHLGVHSPRTFCGSMIAFCRQDCLNPGTVFVFTVNFTGKDHTFFPPNLCRMYKPRPFRAGIMRAHDRFLAGNAKWWVLGVQLHTFSGFLATSTCSPWPTMSKRVVLLFWDILVVISIIPSTFFVTYQAVFNASVVWQWPVIYAGDVIYIVAMTCNFFRSYTDSRGQVITARRLIVMSYLRSSFFCDLVSIIPFEIVAVVGSLNDLNYIIAILRLNRFIRLYRVWLFLCKYSTWVACETATWHWISMACKCLLWYLFLHAK